MKKIGEVINSNTKEFVAQCFKLETDQLTLPQAPPFGSFVKVKCEELNFDVLGVVYNVQTGSTDNVHQPTALNLTKQELREQQPQIFDLIKTEFWAITIGYITNKIYHFLPPHPPQIHDFVYICSKDEVKSITDNLIFIQTLLNANNVPVAELIAATLRNAYIARDFDSEFKINAGRVLANYLKDDYDKLSAIINRFFI